MSEKPARKPLDDLDARLRQMRAEVEPKPPPDTSSKSGMGMAFELSGHLVAGIMVGVGLGYLLDQWLDTKPWLLVVFFFVGAAAGMLNVYRTVSGQGMALGYRPSPGGQGTRHKAGPEDARGDKDETKGEG